MRNENNIKVSKPSRPGENADGGGPRKKEPMEAGAAAVSGLADRYVSMSAARPGLTGIMNRACYSDEITLIVKNQSPIAGVVPPDAAMILMALKKCVSDMVALAAHVHDMKMFKNALKQQLDETEPDAQPATRDPS